MASKAEYLAQYLTADQPVKKSKKRKRTQGKEESLIIEDDDISGWDSRDRKEKKDDELIVTGRSADFRKKKSSAWTTVAKGEESDADAILRDAQNEQRDRIDNGDEAPAIVGSIPSDDENDTALIPAGLQLPEMMKSTKKKSRKRSESPKGNAPTTIYRDASGRIINVAMARREAARKAEEEERKKREEEKAARGDVQNQMRTEAKQQLADAKYMTLARHADDEEMNDELKDVKRWNDPAAGFLTKEEIPVRKRDKDGKKGPSKPTYRGAFDPNRYGIRPGSRWDGVDRSNGFEKKWFAARNRKKDRDALEYAWQMDE